MLAAVEVAAWKRAVVVWRDLMGRVVLVRGSCVIFEAGRASDDNARLSRLAADLLAIVAAGGQWSEDVEVNDNAGVTLFQIAIRESPR